MNKKDKYSSLNILLGGRVHSVRRRQTSDGKGEIIQIEVWKADAEFGLKEVSIESRGELVVKDQSYPYPKEEDPSSENYHVYTGSKVDEEIKQLFIKLWDSAGTNHYEKAEWKRFSELLESIGALNKMIKLKL